MSVFYVDNKNKGCLKFTYRSTYSFIYAYIIMYNKCLEKATIRRATQVFTLTCHCRKSSQASDNSVHIQNTIRCYDILYSEVKLQISAKECLRSKDAVDCVRWRGHLLLLNAASSQCFSARVASTLVLLCQQHLLNFLSLLHSNRFQQQSKKHSDAYHL